MPKEDEKTVRASARKAGLKPGTEEFDAYVYSTLRKIEKARTKKHTANSKPRKK